jgi:hypothetical protein
MKNFVLSPESQHLIDRLTAEIKHEDKIILQEAKHEHERLRDELINSISDTSVPDSYVEALVRQVLHIKEQIELLEKERNES